ncbi:hypothetical protein Aph01nite_18690 [Acrocarpospora phusangensis]|uniref:Tetratricopeptide repeat protein n=1 Tax=Acrocarpospora phusangensis TaxID=1070424 RepID=A0A919Q9A8_9ACTN|nr:tetratricopeptide repeat protein [Acrocarpospora phusangensis]GIH23559.1 hypothetical protein Aph01nite_18690 [Acrocarpospora phusangensis]
MNVAEIQAALGQIYALPNGRQKAERLELLATAAKAVEDRSLEAEVLLTLIRAYEYSAERDRMPVVFGRLLRIHDDFPAEVGPLSHTIHWTLKWMSYSLVCNPAVPLATTYRWLDELQNRYRQRGFSPRPVLGLRALLAQNLGDQEAAAAAMESSISAPRDEMADCDACERNDWGTWRARAGDDAGALDFWAPVISGERSCAEEPHRVLAKALLPLLRTGRTEDARSAFLRGYSLVRHNVSLRESVGHHIEFCALTGNEARGLELLNEHASWLTEEHEEVSQRVGFVSGVIVLLRRLAMLGYGGILIGDRTLGTTLARLEQEIGELCARYDARNGSTVFSERVAKRLAQEPLVNRLPLGIPATLPQPAGHTVPAPPKRTDATLDDLVVEARRLSETRHPHADGAWERVAASAGPLPETVAAEVEHSRAIAQLNSDPGAAYDALLAVADRFSGLADTAKALAARAAAALARFQTGDRTGGEALAESVTAQAGSAYAAGELTSGEYLTVRRAGPLIAMAALGQRENPAEAELRATRALVEAELAVAEELAVTERTAMYHDLLARIFFALGDADGARAHLKAAVTDYVEAGQPWRAADPAALLGELALRDDDPKAAEDFASKAVAYGGDLLPHDQAAQLSSLLVEAISRQPGRERDLVGAALSAAARWDGLSEPDTLHTTFTAARAYHNLERHAEAVALFEDVMPRVEIPYDAPVIAMTRKQYGASLRELGRHREAAEQFLKGAELVQDNSDERVMYAELAWSAAQALQYSGQTVEAMAAYQRAALLWTELGQLTPRVRCLRSAAWLLRWMGEPDSEEHRESEQPGIAEMRAVLTELEGLAERSPSEEVLAELAETREQLEQLIEYDDYDYDDYDDEKADE